VCRDNFLHIGFIQQGQSWYIYSCTWIRQSDPLLFVFILLPGGLWKHYPTRSLLLSFIYSQIPLCQFSPYQAGFRPGYSTISQLWLAHMSTVHPDHKRQIHIFLDLEKAYDRVPIPLLLDKLLLRQIWRWTNCQCSKTFISVRVMQQGRSRICLSCTLRRRDIITNRCSKIQIWSW
jgi:hypothetical protein